MMGAGTAGSGTKDTWKTGVLLTIAWIVSTSYVAVISKTMRESKFRNITLMFVSIDIVKAFLGVCFRHLSWQDVQMFF